MQLPKLWLSGAAILAPVVDLPPPGPRQPTAQSRLTLWRRRVSHAAHGPQAAAGFLAILIGFASVLSAVVAWRASLASIDASRYESLAVQQQARVQQIQRELAGRVAQDLRFVNVFQEHALSARELQAQADQLRTTDPDAADVLDLQAQAQLDLARGVAPFFVGATGPKLNDDGTVTYDVAYVMTNLEATNTELRELRTQRTRATGAAGRHQVGQPHRRRGSGGCGALLPDHRPGSSGTRRDPPDVLRRRRSPRRARDHLPGRCRGARVTLRQNPALAADAGEGRPADRLTAVVAIVIAFTTFVAAVAGFLQADTAQSAGNRRGDAEQLALQALASAQSSRETAQVELETFHLWLEQRTQAGNALLASLYSSSDPVRQNALLLEQQRWETIAAATLKQSQLEPTSEFGPENDPRFPQRYLSAATGESLRLNALQDAANEEASSLDVRAAAYTAVLAMLAVALYLFGLTLAVTGRWRRLGFFTVGMGMLGVSLLWIAQAALLPPHETNDEAAAEYAAGKVAATTAFDAAGFRQAEQHYARAIELRPTFARAYSDRAAVTFQAASPQRSGFISIAPPEALARSAADLRSALGLGLENAPTLGDLGFYLFAEGVQSADIDILNQSIDYTRRAITLDPTEPIYRYNLGAALAASGRFDEARAAYQEAVRVTIYVDPQNNVLRQEPNIEESWLAGALTDLEIVNRYGLQLQQQTGLAGFEAQITSLKEHIVGRVVAESPDAPPVSPAAFADITPSIFPAELQWQGTVTDYDPARDTISAQWYHNDPEGHGWAVIPEVSLTQKPTIQVDGSLFQLTPYTGRVVPVDCLPTGSYRVELYVNGRLAARGEATADFGDFDAFMARDLTMAFCRPSDWIRIEDRLPGLIDGYTSADAAYGVYGARYSLPGSLRSLQDIAAQIEDLTIIAFAEWFPARRSSWNRRAPPTTTSWASSETGRGVGTTTGAATSAWVPA